MESYLCKIFVGNVPFQCNQDEFKKCFEKLKGFIKAEIVCKTGTNLSRGFGFITFDTPENAKNIIGINTIIFKDRKLRFTEYALNDNMQLSPTVIINKNKEIIKPCDISSNNISQKRNINNESEKNILLTNPINNKNLITVKNLKENTTRQDLYDIFNKYSDIGRHFLVLDQETGLPKSCGVVEILDSNVYDFLLDQQKLVVDENQTLELSKWKLQKDHDNFKKFTGSTISKSDNKKITKFDLFKAFTAGRSVGMVEAQRSNRHYNIKSN